MEVKVLFFGVLTDVAGISLKIYRDSDTLNDLKYRINDDFPEIVHYNFRISLNGTITNGNANLKDGDEIALMPPFAGG